MLLEEVSQDRNNNLNLLRFVAAVMVVFCHAYPLSLGSGFVDPLGRITNGQIHMGGLAVCIFFFFSGFFLNRSVNKGQGAYIFFKARCIRIFPSLFAVITVSVFFGSCITTEGLLTYYTNPQTYEYLLNSILILRHELPGVFENNIYNPTVNGSLWTLPVEFVCYIVCYLVWRMGLSKEKVMKYTIPFFVVGYISLHIVLEQYKLLNSALRPCGMFYVGMLFDTYRKKIFIKQKYLILCIIGLILSTYFGFLEYGAILFLSYVLIYIVFGTNKKMSTFGNKYEISYGMYLSAFPIQQTVVMFHGGQMNPITNFFICMPIILLMGWGLNVCVEKHLIN